MNNPQYSILTIWNAQISFCMTFTGDASSVQVAVKFLTKQLISPKPQHVFLCALANNATLQVVSW